MQTKTAIRPSSTAPTIAVGARRPTDRLGTVPPRRAAVIAGVGYVMLFVLGIFSNFVVRSGMIEPGDATATASNIAASEGLFRLGMVSFMVVFVVDVVVAWALYIVFRTADRDLSLLAAWFRVVYTVFLGVGLIFFFQALQLISGVDYLTAFDQEQLEAQMMIALDAFNYTWLIGLAAFGIHLVVLGYLILRYGLAKRALGWLLLIAGGAYVIDTVANAVMSNYREYETPFLIMVALPAVISEGWFGLWLLLKAGKGELFVAHSAAEVHDGDALVAAR